VPPEPQTLFYHPDCKQASRSAGQGLQSGIVLNLLLRCMTAAQQVTVRCSQSSGVGQVLAYKLGQAGKHSRKANAGGTPKVVHGKGSKGKVV
jgi:hypothetical protein